MATKSYTFKCSWLCDAKVRTTPKQANLLGWLIDCPRFPGIQYGFCPQHVRMKKSALIHPSKKLDWIEAALQRANQATKGPWVNIGTSVGPKENSNDALICDCWCDELGGFHKEREANAAFIANARTDVPRLIKRIRELEKVLNIPVLLVRSGEKAGNE